MSAKSSARVRAHILTMSFDRLSNGVEWRVPNGFIHLRSSQPLPFILTMTHDFATRFRISSELPKVSTRRQEACMKDPNINFKRN